MTRDFSVPASEEATLTFRFPNAPDPAGAAPLSVILKSETTEGVKPLIAATIGVDFGSAYSTVALRVRYNDPNLADDVRFLKPPGEENDRIPTLVFAANDGLLEFGTKAQSTYLSGRFGQLLREIKTLLRDQETIRKSEAGSGNRFCANFNEDRLIGILGAQWYETLTTRYLRWLYDACILPALRNQFGTTDVEVRYLFTLPALDCHETPAVQYLRQKEAMARCLKQAGFPIDTDDPARNRVDFEYEPVCAALALLNPPAEIETDTDPDQERGDRWPLLGSKKYPIRAGQKVAVFDSGGGTTDVILASVLEKSGEEAGQIGLQVERCLGVGRDSETLGGIELTQKIVMAISDPKTVPPETENRALVRRNRLLRRSLRNGT